MRPGPGNILKPLFWFGYLLAATVFFGYILFPATALIEYTKARIHRDAPWLQAEIADVRPCFPLGLRYTDITLRHKDKTIGQIAAMELIPTSQTYIGRAKVLRLKGDVFGGQLTGKLDLDAPDSRSGILRHIEIKGAMLDRLTVLSPDSGFKLAGQADLKLHRPVAQRLPLRGDLELKGVRLALGNPFPGIDALDFSDIKARMAFQQPRLTFEHIEWTGPQTTGRLKGTAELKSPVGETRLDLSGAVMPQPVFLARLKQSVPAALLPKPAPGTRDIPIRLRGSVGDPDVAFR